MCILGGIGTLFDLDNAKYRKTQQWSEICKGRVELSLDGGETHW